MKGEKDLNGCPGVTYSYDEEYCCLSFYFEGNEVTCWRCDDADFVGPMCDDFEKIYNLGVNSRS